MELGVILKVLAYVTSRDRLLVFRHVHFPEAGLQIPAGTVEEGESLEDAALREAREETGLDGLRLVGCLGSESLDMAAFGKSEIHHRTFFHLEAEGAVPDLWQHWEASSDVGRGAVLFECFWAPLSDLPELVAGQGAFVGRIGSRG